MNVRRSLRCLAHGQAEKVCVCRGRGSEVQQRKFKVPEKSGVKGCVASLLVIPEQPHNKALPFTPGYREGSSDK